MITTEIKDILFRVEKAPVHTSGGLFAGYCLYDYNTNKVLKVSLNDIIFTPNNVFLAECEKAHPRVKWQWAYYTNDRDLFHIIGHLNSVSDGLMVCLEAINSYNHKSKTRVNYCLMDVATKAYIYTNLETYNTPDLYNIILNLKNTQINMPASDGYVTENLPYYIRDIHDVISEGMVFDSMLDLFRYYAQLCMVWRHKSFDLSRKFITKELDKVLSRKELMDDSNS